MMLCRMRPTICLRRRLAAAIILRRLHRLPRTPPQVMAGRRGVSVGLLCFIVEVGLVCRRREMRRLRWVVRPLQLRLRHVTLRWGLTRRLRATFWRQWDS